MSPVNGMQMSTKDQNELFVRNKAWSEKMWEKDPGVSFKPHDDWLKLMSSFSLVISLVNDLKFFGSDVRSQLRLRLIA